MSQGVDLKKLRQIARAHIEKAASGDMQAIKELADRLDGKPIEMRETQGLQQLKVISEIVHVNLSPEELSALNEAQELSAEPMPIERHRANGSGRSDVNGSGGLNEDTGGNRGGDGCGDVSAL
jgi:hypothetical protein